VLELSLPEGPVLLPVDEAGGLLPVVDSVVLGSAPEEDVASAVSGAVVTAVVPPPLEPPSVPDDSTEDPP